MKYKEIIIIGLQKRFLVGGNIQRNDNKQVHTIFINNKKKIA